jgi:hypothetical protein
MLPDSGRLFELARTDLCRGAFRDYELVAIRWTGDSARANAGYCRSANDSVELHE